MKSSNPDKRTILITGTSRGLGRNLAEYFLQQGYFVVGCSRTDVEIRDGSYRHFALDLSEERELLEMFKSIRKDFGGLDVLVNNAAINPAIVSAAFLPIETIQKAFHVNVFAPMLCCREAFKLMNRRRFGRIINIGSMATRHEVPSESLYTSTKAAMNAFTRVFAKEIYKSGVTVNVVAPAALPTDLSAAVDQNALREVLGRNAIKEIGSFDDVGGMIEFLVRASASAVTGQIIYLGGV